MYNKQGDLYNLAITKVTKEQYNTIMNKKYPDPFYRIQELFIAAEMDIKEYFAL